MILQRDRRNLKVIRNEGCYYFDVLYHANRLANVSLSTSRINKEIYRNFVDFGYMKKDCWIMRPEKMFEYFGIDVTYLGKKESDYICNDDEFEILLFRYLDMYHFVCGNGFGDVTYDPWGVSLCATKGELRSKRVFRLLKIRE